MICVPPVSFKLEEAAANNSHEEWTTRLRRMETSAKIVKVLSGQGINCIGKTTMDADYCE